MPTIHKEVVDHMIENDSFSQWLGIEVLEIKEGYSKDQNDGKKGNGEWIWNCSWRHPIFTW
jgi:hypothetical protein